MFSKIVAIEPIGFRFLGRKSVHVYQMVKCVPDIPVDDRRLSVASACDAVLLKVTLQYPPRGY